MSRVVKFLRLSLPDKLVRLEALATLAVVRAALAVRPFRSVSAYALRISDRSVGPALRPPSPAELARVVASVSKYVPGATCLPQALAAQILLGRRGCPTTVRIGVAREGMDGLEAHAWLECEGAVIL